MTQKYRVRTVCRGCGKVYVTDPKDDRSTPDRHYESREDGCGSTKTESIDSWPVSD